MSPDTKEELTTILDLLKASVKKNGVSLAVDEDGNIMFFDTEIYLRTDRMDGFKINVKDITR